MSRADLLRRPDDLEGEAAAEWDRLAVALVRLGTLTPETRDQFADYCRAWHRWVEAAVRLEGDDLMIEGPDGRRVPNPAIEERDQAARDIERHSKRLGLSPLDRARLGLRTEGPR